MSSSQVLSPGLFRLPRELRDQIYTYVFQTAPMEWLNPNKEQDCSGRIFFPVGWTRKYGHDSTKFFHSFPAICYVSHQLFQESVPVFLRQVEAFSFNTETCQRLFDWLLQFPGDIAFKAIKDYQSFEWNAFDATSINLHTNLLSRMSNLESLLLEFTFPDLAHSWKEDDYDWEEEQNLFSDFGIPYPFQYYYTPEVGRPDINARHLKWPGDHEVFKNERRLLQEKLEEFVTIHHLELVVNLGRLVSLELQFDVQDQGKVRHNLSRPLFLWFNQMWEEKGRTVEICTGFDENP